MINGFLHGLQHNEQTIDLLFGPYAPDGLLGAMKPRRFSSRAELTNFLAKKIGADEIASEDFLRQLDSRRHATMNEVWLTEEQRRQLGL